MKAALSKDLRKQITKAVTGGSSARAAAARTVPSLWNAIGKLIDTFTPAECANYLAAAGYDAT